MHSKYTTTKGIERLVKKAKEFNWGRARRKVREDLQKHERSLTKTGTPPENQRIQKKNPRKSKRKRFSSRRL